MQKKKNLMRLKTRPYYALQGLVQTTGSAGGYDFFIFKFGKFVQGFGDDSVFNFKGFQMSVMGCVFSKGNSEEFFFFNTFQKNVKSYRFFAGIFNRQIKFFDIMFF